MTDFLHQHASRVIGHLKGWDRLRLRGTLRCIAFAKGLSSFLQHSGRTLTGFGHYADWSSKQLCQATRQIATDARRPLIYLTNPGVNKEATAQEIAQRAGIEQGLICTLSAVEPCWSFRLIQKRDGEAIGVQRAYRKCLHFYQYHMHPLFGLMHLRLQTWMPFNLHLCLNGRQWLARQMDAAGIKYLRKANCFPWVEDVQGAQRLLQEQVDLDWEPVLRQVVVEMNPAINRVLHPYDVDYYWSIDESEWATDVMFGSEGMLNELYPSLIRHGIESFGSRDVMRFLGQRVPLRGNVHPRDCREVVSDVKGRPEGIRIKHRIGENSVKMYNKQGSVLRIETTLNNVRQLKVPRRREGKVVWNRMRKGVADARRRAQVSDQANERYGQALAAVGSPLPLKQLTRGLSEPARLGKQRIRGLNLFAAEDMRLLEIVGRGEFLLNGLRNRDVQQHWYAKATGDETQTSRRSAQISRKLRMLRAHGLIRKVPRTHRYFVTDKGRQLIAALMAVGNANIAQLSKAA